MKELFHQFVDQIVDIVQGLGYFGIFILMTLESSFVPFPSEVVLIPAGFLATKGEMSLGLILLASVGGSLAGACINYYLSLFLGRKFIINYGRYFLLKEDKFLLLEEGFLKHGKFATFFGRLIFGIRQWISIPAGLAKMPFLPFAVLTSAGALIWSAILVLLGYFLGTGEDTVATAKLIGLWMVGAIVLITGAYVWWQSPGRKKQPATEVAGPNGAAKA
jgi:membrane protein DedA with SNARE-associated domain